MEYLTFKEATRLTGTPHDRGATGIADESMILTGRCPKSFALLGGGSKFTGYGV